MGQGAGEDPTFNLVASQPTPPLPTPCFPTLTVTS